jgi:hypothetical protein
MKGAAAHRPAVAARLGRRREDSRSPAPRIALRRQRRLRARWLGPVVSFHAGARSTATLAAIACLRSEAAVGASATAAASGPSKRAIGSPATQALLSREAGRRMSPACCPHRAVAGVLFPARSCCSVEHRAHPTSRPLMAHVHRVRPRPGIRLPAAGRSRSAMRDPSVQTRLTTIDGDPRPASRPGEHPRPVVRKGGGEHIEVVDVCCQDRLRQADGNAHQMGIHDVDGAGA